MSANPYRPATIALVGCDGCGKSAHVARLEQEFLRSHKRVVVDDKWRILNHKVFPECRFIRGELDGLRSCVCEMEGIARTLFVFWLISITVERALKTDEAEVIIHDGYWPKHACAEIEYGASPELVTALAAALPPADLTVLLDAAPEITLVRKIRAKSLTAYECGRDPGKSPLRFLEHQSRIRERMLAMARASRWHIVDASQSEHAVWSEIRQIAGRLRTPSVTPAAS